MNSGLPGLFRALAPLAVALALMSCAAVREWLQSPSPEPPPLPVPAAVLPQAERDAGVASPPTWLEGPHLKAMSVALMDLTSRIARDSARAERVDPLSACLARMDAYDAQIVGEAPDRWLVYLEPRDVRCFDGGGWLKGGAATYEIGKSDYRILGATLWE